MSAKLRADHRATLLSISRNGKAFVNPPSDFTILAGDDAVVVAESLGTLAPLVMKHEENGVSPTEVVASAAGQVADAAGTAGPAVAGAAAGAVAAVGASAPETTTSPAAGPSSAAPAPGRPASDGRWLRDDPAPRDERADRAPGALPAADR